MYMSARDIARIGAMVAQNGVWNGAQVVPAKWIETSISPLTDLTLGPLNYGPIDSFGYIWWLYNRGEVVRADGYGGHLMLIGPARDITVVERNFSGNSYLSTGLWMMMSDDDKRSNSFKGAVRARAALAEMLDAN
jgi:CubicO group peptidase (beta-lactamase class C family)